MAILNSTIVGGKLTVNGAISQNGSLLSDTYAAKDHTHSQYLTSHQDISGKLDKTGGTITGTLVLSKAQDASGTANNSPALIVGGTETTQHLEFDGNEILSKSDGTHGSTLFLNYDGGGDVYFGNGDARFSGGYLYSGGSKVLTSHQAVSSSNNTASWGG